jgi:excisionase family DNA binding protein
VTQPQTPPPAFYTTAEVARILRCSLRTVQNMIHRQQLPATIIGKNRYRIPRSALEALLYPGAVDEEATPCAGTSQHP